MKISVPKLLMDLFTASGDVAIDVQVLLRVGEVFGKSESAIRVSLGRLVSKGLLVHEERGSYRLAEGARPIQRHVTSWEGLESRMSPWEGGWIGAFVGGLGRSPSREQRKRLQALRFLGFRELRRHLWVRPGNLQGGVEWVREHLLALGLESRALVCAVEELSPEDDEAARSLWDCEALEQQYEELLQRVVGAHERLQTLSIEEGMRETFSIGGEMLHHLAYDPLLPEALLCVEKRAAFVEAFEAYERAGWALWRQFMDLHELPSGRLQRALVMEPTEAK